MKNNQLLPFERNRYYAGKALTSMDFQAEQQYMNDKRRFINNVVFGSGIVCGLSVFNLDDLSFIVESGVAIDGQGREIVVEKSVVYRLSAIEGADSLKTNRAMLYIRYKEDEVHPVYCAGNGENEYQCNRIAEGYELFVKDKEEESFLIGDDYLIQEQVADTEDYMVDICIPSIVAKKRTVKLLVSIKKKTSSERTLSLRGVLQLPMLKTTEDSHELTIDIQGVQLEKEAVFEKEYWLYVEDGEMAETTIIDKGDTFKLWIDDQEEPINTKLNLKLMLMDLTPDEIASRELGKLSLEMRNMGADIMAVPIAEISLIRTEVAALIEKIKDKEIKNYINTPAQMNQRVEFLSYFGMPEYRRQEQICKEQLSHQYDVSEFKNSLTSIATGVFEIPLKPNMRKGDICLSEEIMHGLGKGNVYVDVGVVSLEDDIHLQTTTNTTIYGNPNLFKQGEHMRFETAVKVYKDKGSFQIAAKLLGEQKSIVLVVEWIAIKFASSGELNTITECDGMRIYTATPTVRMRAKSTYFFEVKFENMEPCGLSYELTEDRSGEISQDGVYTAPSKEGVYEVHIYCTDNPSISTYAYAIVNK